jgi:hypothetical protein
MLKLGERQAKWEKSTNLNLRLRSQENNSRQRSWNIMESINALWQAISHLHPGQVASGRFPRRLKRMHKSEASGSRMLLGLLLLKQYYVVTWTVWERTSICPGASRGQTSLLLHWQLPQIFQLVKMVVKISLQWSVLGRPLLFLSQEPEL